MVDISSAHDTIDPRDVDERIEELEDDFEAEVLAAKDSLEELTEELTATDDRDEREELTKAIKEAESKLEALEVEHGPELEELKLLRGLAEDCEHYAHGDLLINDSYFEEYARQLAEDIGAIDSNAGWPLGCIDWKQAADELKADYTAIEFDGETFWVRS